MMSHTAGVVITKPHKKSNSTTGKATAKGSVKPYSEEELIVMLHVADHIRNHKQGVPKGIHCRVSNNSINNNRPL